MYTVKQVMRWISGGGVDFGFISPHSFWLCPVMSTVCSSLTRTLDSGIGTFPPPDYCSGMPCKSVPKLRPRLDPPPAGPLPPRGPPSVTRVPRKARTLEREVPSTEDLMGPSKHQSMPAFHGILTSAEPALNRHDRRGYLQGLFHLKEI